MAYWKTNVGFEGERTAPAGGGRVDRYRKCKCSLAFGAFIAVEPFEAKLGYPGCVSTTTTRGTAKRISHTGRRCNGQSSSGGHGDVRSIRIGNRRSALAILSSARTRRLKCTRPIQCHCLQKRPLLGDSLNTFNEPLYIDV